MLKTPGGAADGCACAACSGPGVHAEFPDATAIGFSADGRRLLTFGPDDPPAQERRMTWWDTETRCGDHTRPAESDGLETVNPFA